MANGTPVNLLPGTLSSDCYPESAQALNVEIITKAQAFLNEDFPGIYVGPTAPPVDQRNRLWFNTAPNSFHWYQYVNGDWMRVYEIAASSDVEWVWKGSEANLKTFAGGDTNALGTMSGPLWEIDHEIDGRVIVGAGDVPGSDPAASIAQGAIADSNGSEGAYQVALTEAQGAVGQHIHPFGLTNVGNDDAYFKKGGVNTVPGYTGYYVTGSNGNIEQAKVTADLFTSPPGLTGAGVTATAHKNMPQFRARWVIKRTSRIWVLPPN